MSYDSEPKRKKMKGELMGIKDLGTHEAEVYGEEKVSTVYIVNKAGHDFGKAKIFGELYAVTTGNINVFRPDRDLFHITEALKDFHFIRDYLLLSGNVFANALAVAALMARQPLQINFLIYDAKHQKYMKHRLEFHNEELVFGRDESPSFS